MQAKTSTVMELKEKKKKKENIFKLNKYFRYCTSIINVSFQKES